MVSMELSLNLMFPIEPGYRVCMFILYGSHMVNFPPSANDFQNIQILKYLKSTSFQKIKT